MMVRPTYKDYWDIPGGYVEPGETPYEACVREVEEELGIRPTIGRLLVADWAPSKRDGDKILFIFNGGYLTPEQHKFIKLQADELSDYRYVNLLEVPELTIPRLSQRLQTAHSAAMEEKFAYLENGQSLPAE